MKRSASGRLGVLVPLVGSQIFPGFFHGMALLGLCLKNLFPWTTVVHRPTSLLSYNEKIYFLDPVGMLS